MGSFEISSIYMGGLQKALEPLNLTADERAMMTPASRTALASPSAQR